MSLEQNILKTAVMPNKSFTPTRPPKAIRKIGNTTKEKNETHYAELCIHDICIHRTFAVTVNSQVSSRWLTRYQHQTRQAFISELHRFSLLQLLLPQNMLEQLVLSGLGPPNLSWSIGVVCDWRGDSSSVPTSRDSNVGHGPSLHVHKGIAAEGNGLQVTGQNTSEETEATRFLRISGVQVEAWSSASRVWRMHGLHMLRDRWSCFSFAVTPDNFTKDIIPCLQSGHGIEPNEPIISDWILLVEQR